jgi:hypothetical protein
MTSQCESLSCGDAAMTRTWHPTPKWMLKLAVALGIAFALISVETWAIEQAPMWSSACILKPATAARAANDDSDSPLRDTAGPVAVLH